MTIEDKYERMFSEAAKACERISKALFEFCKELGNLKKYKPMKMRKRRTRVWQSVEENHGENV